VALLAALAGWGSVVKEQRSELGLEMVPDTYFFSG
jgi:hypothetical protein